MVTFKGVFWDPDSFKTVSRVKLMTCSSWRSGLSAVYVNDVSIGASICRHKGESDGSGNPTDQAKLFTKKHETVALY